MPSGPTRVLLVEDDEEDYLIAEDLLDEAPGDYLLRWVTSLDAALDDLVSEEIDVCLVDFRLGGATGLELLATARSRNITVPFVLLTGLGDDEIDRAAMDAGAADYLVKSGLTADALDRSLRYACSQADLTRRLSHQAYHDLVTGTANRRKFNERLREILSRSAREPRCTALIFLDLDDFKRINDSHGHGTGDQLLQGVAGRLRQCLRDHDMVARFGGDEFAICVDLGPSDDAEIRAVALAERIVETLAEPYDLDGIRVDITCSAGITMDRGGRIDPDALVTQADVALYQAKGLGKNTVAVFEEQMHEIQREVFELRNHLMPGLESGELVLDYQPIVEVESLRVIGFEGLCRWDHPTRGRLGPDRFIALAESSGQIHALGSYVLEQACGDAVAMGKATGTDPIVTVNVSPRQLQSPLFVKVVENSLSITGLRPELLVLEITESAMISDFDATLVDLQRLKSLGIKLALDDFGSGFSALNLLHRLPLDLLKLDRLFLQDAASDERAASIVETVTHMTRRLGVTALAEGVENQTDHDFIKGAGFVMAQGYGYAHPMPYAEALALLHTPVELATSPT